MQTMMIETMQPQTAEVLGVLAGGRLRIQMNDGAARQARLAVTQPVAAGDEVLVIEGAEDQSYVIGVLRSDSPRRLVLSDEDELEVFNARGEIVFVHEAGRTRMVIPNGDLELAAPNGTVSIQGRDVDIAAKRCIRVDGDRFEGEVRSVHLLGDRIESVFTTVVSTAENAYWKVTQLARLLTGRLRVRADTSCNLKANTTSIRSEKDTRIDGEHIRLG